MRTGPILYAAIGGLTLLCLIGALFEVQHARLPDRSFVATADQLNSAVPTGFRKQLKSTNQPPGSNNIQPAVAALPPAATDARILAGGTFAATETSVRRAADEEEIQTLKQGAGKKDGAKKVEEDQPTWMSQRKATFDELVADGANKVETRVEGHFLGGPVSMVYGEDHPTWWADQAHGKFNVQEAYDVVMAVKVSQRKAKFEELVAAGGVPSAGKKTIPPPDVGAAGLRTAETQCDNNGLLTSGNGQQQDAHKEFIQKLESNWENKMQLMSTDASAPVLKFQLRPGEPKVNVYIWNDGEPTNKLRELRLLAEGLIQHPAVELVSSPETARLIMWPTTMASWEKEVIPAGCKNLVLLDYSDGCNRHPRSPVIYYCPCRCCYCPGHYCYCYCPCHCCPYHYCDCPCHCCYCPGHYCYCPYHYCYYPCHHCPYHYCYYKNET